MSYNPYGPPTGQPPTGQYSPYGPGSGGGVPTGNYSPYGPGVGAPTGNYSPYGPGVGQPAVVVSGYAPQGQYSPYGPGIGGGIPVVAQVSGPPPPSEGFTQQWYCDYYRRVDANQQHSLWAWFQSVNRGGYVTASEIAQLRFPGQQGPLSQQLVGQANAKGAVELFEKDVLDFYELTAFVQFATDLQNGFYSADRNHSGFLDEREVSDALAVAGFRLGFPVCQSYYRKMVRPGQRGLDIASFIQLGFSLAKVRQSFAKLDTGHTGRLDLDQVYMLTSQYAQPPASVTTLQCSIF